MEKFGERLSWALKRKNLSAAKVAEMMNLKARQNIYNWINGISKPHADDLAKLAQVLDVSTDYLLLGSTSSGSSLINDQLISISKNDYIEYLTWKTGKLEKENERLRQRDIEELS